MDADLSGWLIELALIGAPTDETVARFVELIGLIVDRLELLKGGIVTDADLEAMAADLRSTGEVEAAAGVDVLLARAYAEQEHRAALSAQDN